MAQGLRLSELLRLWDQSGLLLEASQNLQDAVITQITDDSRELEEAGIFFARKGLRVDGHDFLDRLPVRAHCVVIQDETKKGSGPSVWVRDTTAAMAMAAKELCQDPSKDLFCVAVTGTNGKTTSSFLLHALLDRFLGPAALMGTVETRFGSKSWPSSLTTPNFLEIQKRIHELRNKSAKSFVFEASSHALDQRRLLGIEVDVALFTNLTHDHLDYHQSMEAYFEAKKKLFSEVLAGSSKKRKLAVLPDDARYGSRLIDELKSMEAFDLLTWRDLSLHSTQALSKQSVHAELRDVVLDIRGSQFKLCFPEGEETYRAPLVGRYNVHNLVGVIILMRALGMRAEAIQEFLNEGHSIPGRLERVGDQVLVDYAHTPDALENVLKTLKPLCAGKLKVLFGCGGDRDRLKRPLMAEVAEIYGDEIFLTSDNPRTEDPLQIIEEIKAGFQSLKPLHLEVDREKSIFQAVRSLQDHDILVLAGKGHETQQVIGQEKRPFDDREVARRALEGGVK